jgi:amino acid adenylation domain-containing protein
MNPTPPLPSHANLPPALFTVCDLLGQHELLDTRGTALVDGEQRISYPELLHRVRRSAAWFQAQGIRKGDRVALFLRRSADLAIAWLGALQAGAVAVVVNEKLRARQVEHVVSHSQASLLLSERSLLATAGEGASLGPAPLHVLEEVALPDRELRESPVIGSDLAMIIYTSGSTGLPKGIMLSHQNLVEGAETVSSYLSLTARDVVISLLPFSFDYGLNQLTTMLRVGGTLVIQRSLFPADVCRTLTRESVTGMAGVPLLWSQLAGRLSPFLRREFPSLRYLTNSGGAFPEHLVERFHAAHPQAQLFLMYGLTEAFRSTYLPPEEALRRPGSMGRAIPNVEILLVDERGEPCGVDQPGVLVHRGAHVSQGYWRDPEATARVFRPHPFLDPEQARQETVVYSGDIVRRDADGFLYFVGRGDQMIKSQGVRVSPEEVEHYLLESRLVASAAVFAVPRESDTAIVAAILPADPASFDPLRLEEYCRSEMPEYMQPAEFVVLDELPQTATGKPDRGRLRHDYLER